MKCCPIHHVTYAPAKFEVATCRSKCFALTDKKIHYLTFDLEAKVTQIVAQATVKYTFPICTCKVEAATCKFNSLGAYTKLYQK